MTSNFVQFNILMQDTKLHQSREVTCVPPLILQAQAKIMRKFQNYLGGADLRRLPAETAKGLSPRGGATARGGREQGGAEAPQDEVAAAIESALESAVQVLCLNLEW